MLSTEERPLGPGPTGGLWTRLLLVAALVGAAILGMQRQGSVNAAGAPDAIEDFVLPTLGGPELRLSEALQRGPVILDFWATWCAPCRLAMPAYAALAERYADRGVQLWAISWDHPRMHDRIGPWFEKNGFDFPALLDADHAVGRALGVANLPTTLLVAPDGRVVYRHVGFARGDERLLEKQLLEILPDASADAGD